MTRLIDSNTTIPTKKSEVFRIVFSFLRFSSNALILFEFDFKLFS